MHQHPSHTPGPLPEKEKSTPRPEATPETKCEARRFRDPLKVFVVACLAGVWLLACCTSTKMTTTARSATEQLLLSTATDHALQKIGLEMFAGRTVFLDATYFDSYDPKYVLGSVRDALSRAGARLVDNVTNAEIVMEVRSGALVLDQTETIFGLPSLGVPIPLAGTVQTPEIAFYKSETQRSYGKFALLSYNRQSSAHTYSSGPLDGKSFDRHARVLFVAWHRTDVPERKLTREETEKYQTWYPQYDLTNLPPTIPATNAPVK